MGKWLIAFGTMSILMAGCVSSGHEDVFDRVEVQSLEGCDEQVDLETDLLVPLRAACGGCHGAAGLGALSLSDEAGKITPDSFAAALVGVSSFASEKPLIESGSEANSFLVDRVLQREASIMPPSGPALEEEVAQALRCWVEQGTYKGLEDE